MDKKIMYRKIIANFLVLIVAVLCLKIFIPYIISLLLPFILAYIIAIIANPIVKFLDKKIKINRKFGSVFIICGVLTTIILIFYYGIKTLISFIMEIVNNVSIITTFINDLSGKIQEIIDKFHLLGLSNTINITNLSTSLNVFIENISTGIIEKTGDLISFLPMFFVIFFITVLSAYFMLREEFTIRLTYFEKYEKFKLIKKEIVDVVHNYLIGQVKIMFLIFIILTIGFGIMKIKYFVLIAFLVAIVDLLPIFGTGTVLYPWIAISLIYGNYDKAIALFIIYIIAFIARQLLQPKIISTSIGLEPLPTLFFMFIGLKLWGLSGLILAPPIGLIIIKLYEIGVFDNYKNYLIYLYRNLKNYLKIDEKEFKK